jgi:hypothetical protein
MNRWWLFIAAALILVQSVEAQNSNPRERLSHRQDESRAGGND